MFEICVGMFFFCFFLSHLIQLYIWSGNAPKYLYIFIHRGMTRGIMYLEDVRGEGPRHRVKHWSLV